MELEKSIPLFDDFEVDWLRQHKRSIPRKPRISSYGLIFRIALWCSIAGIAAIVSAAHTIPAALQTIPLVVESPIREIAAILVFGILEGAIFAGSLDRRENGFARALLFPTMVAALAGNIGSSVLAVNQNLGDWLTMIMAVVMAILAPVSAFLAGEMAHTKWQQHNDKIAAATLAYEGKIKEMEAQIRRDYNKLVKTIEKEQRDAISREDFMKFRELHESSQDDMKSDEPRKPRVKLHEVAKQIHEAGDEGLSVDEMMRKYGISQGSTSKVRDILKQQHGKGYTNGLGGGIAQ